MEEPFFLLSPEAVVSSLQNTAKRHNLGSKKNSSWYPESASTLTLNSHPQNCFLSTHYLGKVFYNSSTQQTKVDGVNMKKTVQIQVRKESTARGGTSYSDSGMTGRVVGELCVV